MRLDKLSEGEASFRRALRHDERCSQALFNLGQLLARLDRYDEAIESYRAGLALVADTPTSIRLADLLAGTERFAEAEQVAREGLRHDPNDSTLTSILASIHHKRGRTPEALDILRAAEARRPTDLVVLATLVEVLVEAGRHAEAITTAERLVSAQPGHASQTILGWTYLETGNASLALDTLDDALKLSEQEEDIERAQIRGLRAGALVALNRQGEAADVFRELERRWPQLFLRNTDIRRYAKRVGVESCGPCGQLTARRSAPISAVD